MLQSLFTKAISCCSLQSVFPWDKGCRALHSFDRQRRLEMIRAEQKQQYLVFDQQIEKEKSSGIESLRKYLRKKVKGAAKTEENEYHLFKKRKLELEWKKNLRKNKVFWTVINEEEENIKVLMNKNISSFRDCIKHISRLKADRTALVYTDGKYKSLLEKLTGSGTMTPLGYSSRDKHHADAVNKAYWRTCAFVLGAVIEESFSTNVELVGPSKVDYHLGRFEYIAWIENLYDWTPKSEDLFALTHKAVGEYIAKPLAIKPLFVSLEFALDLFDQNTQKQKLIHELMIKNENGEVGVTVYRMGDFVDIAYGPLIPFTNHIGKFALTKVERDGSEYRFSGVSVPKELKCSSYSWDLICNASVTSFVK